ncbi:methylenetetrahydrofolate reductase [Aestuariibius sp. 2305UL40-4]|uniref:methylenetetrahydrofolate reductase n=1 Tax=Aestuariibius violaceus TaxID=3234132 RepID=UPI00345E6569
MTRFSFEIFPPKSDAARATLGTCLADLRPLDADFISVTYGAGGSTRSASPETARLAKQATGAPVIGHLTCVGQSREEVLDAAGAYREAGVRRILALRGDPAKDSKGFAPHPDGFADSCALVAALADRGFDVTVAAYPDPHPDAADPGAALDWLKRKQDAGASAAITQFAFTPGRYLRLRDAAVAAGVTIPIIAGILPVKDWTSAHRFARKCGAEIPLELEQAFDTADRHDRARLFALTQATELATDLIAGGMDRLHFYTLNSADLVSDICAALAGPGALSNAA